MSHKLSDTEKEASSADSTAILDESEPEASSSSIPDLVESEAESSSSATAPDADLEASSADSTTVHVSSLPSESFLDQGDRLMMSDSEFGQDKSKEKKEMLDPNAFSTYNPDVPCSTISSIPSDESMKRAVQKSLGHCKHLTKVAMRGLIKKIKEPAPLKMQDILNDPVVDMKEPTESKIIKKNPKLMCLIKGKKELESSENPGASKTEEASKTKEESKTEESSEASKTEESSEASKTEESSEASKTEESSEASKTEESSEASKTEESSEASKTEASETSVISKTEACIVSKEEPTEEITVALSQMNLSERREELLASCSELLSPKKVKLSPSGKAVKPIEVKSDGKKSPSISPKNPQVKRKQP